MSILTTLLLVQGLAPASQLEVQVTGQSSDGAGTTIVLNRGSSDGVELRDHGVLLDRGAVAVAFSVTKVWKGRAHAWVPLTLAEAKELKRARIELTPGVDPPTLDPERLGAAALGSCDTDYKMYRAGLVSTWTKAPTGEITSLWIVNLGWKHRVCSDATGMIYLGDATDEFVAADGKNIRLRVVELGYRTSKVEVVQGKLTEAMLKGNRRVVFRAKK
jgi:hypothetical protein